MTGAKFKQMTNELPDDCEVQVEWGCKTGYDEGDIYIQEPDKFVSYPFYSRVSFDAPRVPGEDCMGINKRGPTDKPVYRLELGSWERAGGW